MALIDDIKEVVIEQLSVDVGEVKEESKFIEDLGADSLDVVELVMALEEKFDIEIPDKEAEKLLSIKDVVDYVKIKKPEEESTEEESREEDSAAGG